MKTLADKVKALLPILEQRGTVYLFALFEREETAGKWDIVLSSEWSDNERGDAVRLISDALVPKLNAEELSALSRIFIAPSHDPAVGELITADQAQHVERYYASGLNFMGVPIRQFYVFRTNRIPRINVAA
jgi:hypothetical protein